MVVLPLVPVMPDHLQLGGGIAVEAGGRGAHRRAHVGHDQLGHAELQRALADQRHGAALDGVGSEVVAVRAEPGTQKKSAPGVTLWLE